MFSGSVRLLMDRSEFMDGGVGSRRRGGVKGPLSDTGPYLFRDKEIPGTDGGLGVC